MREDEEMKMALVRNSKARKYVLVSRLIIQWVRLLARTRTCR